MKKIIFPELKSDLYKSLLLQIIETDPTGSYTMHDVRVGLQVMNKIEETSGNELVLEDQWLAFVKDRVARTKWAVINKEVSDFIESIMTVDT